MTLREWAEQYCHERGMFEGEAESVVNAVVADDASSPMASRWDDRADDYPPQLLTVLAIAICHHAVEWIDANKPDAWYRGLFADSTAARGQFDPA